MQTQLDDRAPNDLAELEQRTLERLGSLCAMEASAARSYDNALAAPQLWPYRHALRAIRDSHEERLQLLSDRLRLSGGAPPQIQRILDSLIAFVEDAAVALGARAAFKAFERGEAHCLNEYRKALDQLDTASRDFLVREVLPRQIGAHSVISTLREEN